jgi:hypothetical protein
MGRQFLFCLGASVALMAQASVVAQTPAPKTQETASKAAVPDLSGFWSLGFGASKTPNAEMVAKLPPNSGFVDDTGGAEFPKGVFGELKLKPEAAAAAERWKPEDDMTISRTCARPSVIYSIQGPFPFEIYQTPQMIVFKYEYFDMVRVIFLDGRGHPGPDAPHSPTGHSIGHWEGDELVVETTHISAATITNNGLDHSDNVRMVERYKLSPDGKKLMATQWFEDPETLDNPGWRWIEWELKPGEYVYPYDCDPSFSANYEEAK